MNSILTITLLLVAICLLMGYVASRPLGRQLTPLCNDIGAGTHSGGRIAFYADAAIATRNLLVKQGTNARHIAVCGAADLPKGVCTDSPDAAEDLANVNMLGVAEETQLMVASGVIAAGVKVYTAAGGKVQAEPTVAGTYYLVGHSITAAAADLDEIEVDPIPPIKLIVLAALTQTSNATIAGLNSTAVNPTKADFDALLVEAGKMQADVYRIAGALATASLVKVLA